MAETHSNGVMVCTGRRNVVQFVLISDVFCMCIKISGCDVFIVHGTSMWNDDTLQKGMAIGGCTKIWICSCTAAIGWFTSVLTNMQSESLLEFNISTL